MLWRSERNIFPPLLESQEPLVFRALSFSSNSGDTSSSAVPLTRKVSEVPGSE